MDKKYYTHVMTAQGINLDNKIKIGRAKPVITRAVAGRGQVKAENEEELKGLLEELTDVIDPIPGKMQYGEKTLLDKRTISLDTRLPNETIDTSEDVYMIGTYALDPDEGEILYQVVQYSTARHLPSLAANRGIPDMLDTQLTITMYNADAAVVPFTPGWLLSREELEAHNQNPQAHQGILTTLQHQMGTMSEEFTTSQQAQDNRIKLLEDMLYSDIQQNKTVIIFTTGTQDVNLTAGIYNRAAGRLEC